MMKKIILFTLTIGWAINLFSQDLNYAKNVIQKLCDPEMEGRGFVKAGDKKAAYYIDGEFRKFKLMAYDTFVDAVKDYQKKFTQNFHIQANTFPEVVRIKLDGKVVLVPGIDYLISPSSSEFNTKEVGIVFLTKENLKNEKAYDLFLYKDYIKMALVIDKEIFEKMPKNEFYERVLRNEIKADMLIFLETKPNLSWGYSPGADKYPTLTILKSKFPATTSKLELTINRKQIFDYESQNVVGYVKGKTSPDSIIIIGAHYDHLGRMGKDTYFPGANDNASGAAMVLDLAKYYSKPENKPDYTMVFIAFGGEEANFAGSKYFIDHPYFPLKNVTFMINLDLMGTGEKGMTVVNGNIFPHYLEILKSINAEKKYLPEILSRGTAPISDHHYFTENGVKCFYFYLMGNYPWIHNVEDKFEKLNLAGYEGTFKLITEFVMKLQQK
jgi:aminopeptidase YwaD